MHSGNFRLSGDSSLTSYLSGVLSSTKRFLGVRELRKRFLLLLFPWICVGMSAYGIHFSVKLVEMNMFAVSAIKEVAVFVIIIVLIPVYNRVNNLPLLIAQILAPYEVTPDEFEQIFSNSLRVTSYGA